MGRLVPAVTRAMDILELFLDRPGALTTPEITRRLGLPRTTVHELVGTLVARDYLMAAPDRPGAYQLGVRAYQLGSCYAEQLDLAVEGRQAARAVAGICGETVHVAVLDALDVVYVAKIDSTHAVRMVSAAGHRLPAHCTAVGKMLLASLPEDELAARLPRAGRLAQLTERSLSTPAAVRRHLAEVRAHGVAEEDREANEDVRCVAAPVHDAHGTVVAAMSISVPTSRWSSERAEPLRELVLKGAADLSGRLGHRSGS